MTGVPVSEIVSEQLALDQAHGGAEFVRVEKLPSGLHLRYAIHAASGPNVETLAGLASASVEVWDGADRAWHSVYRLVPGNMRTRPTSLWPCDSSGEITSAAAEGGARAARAVPEGFAEVQADHEELRRVAYSVLGVTR